MAKGYFLLSRSISQFGVAYSYAVFYKELQATVMIGHDKSPVGF